MAGLKTAEYLATRDYETFYRLAHHLSEEALAGLISIGSGAQLLSRLYQMSLSETCGDPVAAKEAENRALQLHQLAREAARETRRFFWPDRAEGAAVHYKNQGRWSPYDAEAWDAFFTDFVEFMKVRVQTIATFTDQLQAAENPSVAHASPERTGEVWQVLRESYHRLAMLLTEAGFEATLKAP
jgi:hypothetical protein